MTDRRSDPRGTRASSRDGGNERAPQYDGPVEDREARLVGEDPDVVLDVPTLNVEELDLEVEDLRAHVSVRAEVANFVNVNIGVDVYLDKVKLGIRGVEARVLLVVKLERILGTIDRALSAIEQSPGLLDDRLREANRDAAEVEATDAAWRKAKELGVDLSQVEGSGSGGRVLLRDVLKAAG